MIRKYITIFAISGLSLIIMFSGFSYTGYAKETSYYNLFEIELELFPFSSIYKNESMDGFNTFKRAMENASKYPLNSYKLLLECYRIILFYNLSKEIETAGDKKVSEIFIVDVQNNLLNITQEINDFIPTTFASLEWYELAKREIKSANESYIQSKEYYNNKDYNSTLLYLIGADSSVHKAGGYILLAEEKIKWI